MSGGASELRPLVGVRVVEIAGSAAGSYAGKLYAELGATVALIGAAPAGGRAEAARRAYVDSDKEAVPRTETARRVAAADVVIESSAPDPLVAVTDGLGPAELVRVAISPFGTGGPYSAWRSTSITDYAIGGQLRLTGDPGREPLQGPADLPAQAAGLFAACGSLAALIVRRRTGRGQRVEVTHHDALAALHQFTLLRHTHAGAGLDRMGNRYAGPGSPIGMYPARDGPLSMAIAYAHQIEGLLAITGLEHLLERDDVTAPTDLAVMPRVLLPPLLEWLGDHDVAEVVELFQAMRLPASPVLGLTELLDDPHLAERGFWRTVALPDGTTVTVPGSPYRLTAPSRRRAGDAAAGGAAAGGAAADGPAAEGAAAEAPAAEAPLGGVTVIDLTRVWAGPLAGRILADLGADVTWVEAPWSRGAQRVSDRVAGAGHYWPDDQPGEQPWNSNGFRNKYAVNKRSVGLDLTGPDGQGLLARMVERADVVVENYSPRVMPNFGFDERRLFELNPALVYVTMPGYGRTGPARDWVSFGPTVDSHAGHSALIGYRGEGPWKSGVAWPDPVAGMHAAVAALAMLLGRAAGTVEGGTVEVPQLETAISLIGAHVAAAVVEGEPARPGNRHPTMAPQGVYPAAGDDRWVALTVVDDPGWDGLCSLIGKDDWAGLPPARRRERHDQIDDAIAAWTATRSPGDAVAMLQAVGVAACNVADAADVVGDPHLRARASFVTLDHPVAGVHPWPVLPARLSATPACYRRAPLLGEHNREWAADLGLPLEEVERLEAAGVLADRPPE